MDGITTTCPRCRARWIQGQEWCDHCFMTAHEVEILDEFERLGLPPVAEVEREMRPGAGRPGARSLHKRHG